jgi:hypothetical protein
MSGRARAWPRLLRLLCTDAATPLLLRLKCLVLPDNWENTDRFNRPYDAFLRRLSALPSPAALQKLWGMSDVSHRAAGLLSVFSLPHLTQLDLGGSVRRAKFSAFASRLHSAPPSLVLLLLPKIQQEPDDGERDEATVAEDAAVVCRASRALLSRLTSLRRLYCDVDMAGGQAAVSGSPSDDDEAGGCSGSLYSLTVRHDHQQPARFPVIPALSSLCSLSWTSICLCRTRSWSCCCLPAHSC